jgi:hypothetical protein
MVAVVVCWPASGLDAADVTAPTYERDIKPLVAKRCAVCHSKAKQRDPDLSGGLALDSYEGILEGTVQRKVVTPGKSAASELVRRLVDADLERRMPLQDQPLSDAERSLFSRWIDAGVPRGRAETHAAAETARAADTGARRSRRRKPALDVALPTELKIAPGTLGAKRGGALEVVLPAGPLPAVTALAFRGDGRLLAVGTYGQVMLWDIASGEPAGAIRDIPGQVHAVAFSRDGRRLALGAGLPARSGVVRVYSVPDGTLIHDFPGHDDVVFAVALRPDGAQLASGSFDQTVRFWDLGLGRPGDVFRGHSDFVYAVAYTPDGRSLLSASKDRTIKRIDVHSIKEDRTYSGHDLEVLSVAVHPDGVRFVSAGAEPQIRWWMKGGDEPVARRGGHSGPVHQLAFSADGRRLVSASADGSIRVWEVSGKAALRQLSGPTDWQYAAAITGDGRLVAAGGWDGLVRLWDADSGKLRVVLVQPPGDSSTGEPVGSAQRNSVAWFACCPPGPVAGSTGLLQAARWLAGGVALDARDVRAGLVRPDLVARAIRGEPVGTIGLSPKHRE